MRIGSGHEFGLYVRRERMTPDKGVKGRVGREPRAAHARSTCVRRSYGDRVVGDHFSQSSWARAQILRQVLQVPEGVAHWCVQADAMFVRLGEPSLEGAKEAPSAWDGQNHAT